MPSSPSPTRAALSFSPQGYEPKGLQTEAGLLRLHVPQVRETAEPFRSALLGRVGRRSDDLEALVKDRVGQTLLMG